MATDTVEGLVSVIMPVYNRAPLVGTAIESVLAQTYQNVEIIVINDGSTDTSREVIHGYADKFPAHVIAVDQVNTGQTRARNNGIRIAHGEYIAFLDSDDTWEKDKLEQQVPLFKGNVGLVYCAINEVAPDGGIIRTVPCEPGIRGNIYRHLLVNNRMTGGSVVVTRKALERVGLFDETFRAAENWDLWIRISREFEADCVDKPLVNYLKHTDNMSLDYERMALATWKILQKHLPRTGIEGVPKETFDRAYANYHYAIAVTNFSRGDYREARKNFIECWKYKPFFRDSTVRMCRMMLGRHANMCISAFKRKLSTAA